MNFSILQRASGSQAAILNSTSEIHKEYCNFYNYKYLNRISFKPESFPKWNKISAISDWMEFAEYEDEAVWMDGGDTLVSWPFYKLNSTLLKEFDIGMHKQLSGVFNSGVIFIRKTKMTQEFIKELELTKNNLSLMSNYQDQEVINDLVRLNQIKVQEIPRRLNDFKYSSGSQSDRPVIKAWHGEKKCSTCLKSMGRMIAQSRLLMQVMKMGASEESILSGCHVLGVVST